MGQRIFNLAALIVGGVIVADLVANGEKSSKLFNSFGDLWKTSINGLLGKTS